MWSLAEITVVLRFLDVLTVEVRSMNGFTVVMWLLTGLIAV